MSNIEEKVHSGTFSGSTTLLFVSDLTALPIDQVNFISCQLFALVLSCVLKRWIKKSDTRLWFCLICGISISYFCFGQQILHIVTLAGVSYAIIHYNPPNMPWSVLALSMSYMSFLHLRRQFYEFGTYSLDITGPLMVLTQKVTSLAFSVRDGREAKKKEKKSTELQATYAVEGIPSLLKYCSYVFQFQSMLAGPLVMYKDFEDFIETESVPNPTKVVARKLSWSILYAVIFMKLSPRFDVNTLRDEKFLDSMSWLYRVFYITYVTTIERTKYYHAWTLADAVCNASGLGYDHKKKNFDLTSNVQPIQFECGLSLKESLDVWNIGTGKWLRHVMYERVKPSRALVFTYLLSAVWHGFYPGYYITFLSGAVFTMSARTVRRWMPLGTQTSFHVVYTVRRHIRPHFINNSSMKRLYDLATWLTTRATVSYVTFTFMLLDLRPCIKVYAKLYFFLHILAPMSMLIIPKTTKMFQGGRKTPASVQSKQNSAKTNGSVDKTSTTTSSLNGMDDNSVNESLDSKLKTMGVNHASLSSNNLTKLKTG